MKVREEKVVDQELDEVWDSFLADLGLASPGLPLNQQEIDEIHKLCDLEDAV